MAISTPYGFEPDVRALTRLLGALPWMPLTVSVSAGPGPFAGAVVIPASAIEQVTEHLARVMGCDRDELAQSLRHNQALWERYATRSSPVTGYADVCGTDLMFGVNVVPDTTFRKLQAMRGPDIVTSETMHWIVRGHGLSL